MSLYQYCPICGKDPGNKHICGAPGIPDSEMHRCSQRTIRGIDGAMRTNCRKERKKSFGTMLEDGFNMMKGNNS